MPSRRPFQSTAPARNDRIADMPATRGSVNTLGFLTLTLPLTLPLPEPIQGKGESSGRLVIGTVASRASRASMGVVVFLGTRTKEDLGAKEDLQCSGQCFGKLIKVLLSIG